MSDSAAVTKLRDDFIAAFNRQDIDAMAKLTADDMVGMPPNQPAIVGIDASRAWWREGFQVARSRFEASSREIEVLGDWAVDRFDWTMESTPAGGGATSKDKGKCVWISRKQSDGSWKLARAIWNSDEPMPGIWSGAARGTS